MTTSALEIGVSFDKEHIRSNEMTQRGEISEESIVQLVRNVLIASGIEIGSFTAYVRCRCSRLQSDKLVSSWYGTSGGVSFSARLSTVSGDKTYAMLLLRSSEPIRNFVAITRAGARMLNLGFKNDPAHLKQRDDEIRRRRIAAVERALERNRNRQLTLRSKLKQNFLDLRATKAETMSLEEELATLKSGADST